MRQDGSRARPPIDRHVATGYLLDEPGSCLPLTAVVSDDRAKNDDS
jgi:hypothetical protein